MKRPLVLAIAMFTAPVAYGQSPGDWTATQGDSSSSTGQTRIQGQPFSTASDSSWSRIVANGGGRVAGELSLTPELRGLTLDFVAEDAAGCVRFHSIEHQLVGDTLIVTIFRDAPSMCRPILTFADYRVDVAGLPRLWRRLLVYAEGRGGRGGRASGSTPWLSVDRPGPQAMSPNTRMQPTSGTGESSQH